MIVTEDERNFEKTGTLSHPTLSSHNWAVRLTMM